MRSTSALLAGAAAALALMSLPSRGLAQEERGIPAPGPAPSVDRRTEPTPPPPPPMSSPSGGQQGGYSSPSSGSPGWVDRSGSSGPRIEPPSRFGTGGGGVGSGPRYAPPPSRVELPAPRLDPPGGMPRPVRPLQPGLVPRDPGPPSSSPPENIRVDLPGFVTRPGRSGDIGLPEDGPRLHAVEIVAPDFRKGDNRDDERVLPPPDDGSEVAPPIEKRKRPTPPPVEPVTPPNSPSNEHLHDGMGLRGNFYWYGRDYWAEFGWWTRGCYMPLALSEEDEFWARATGWPPLGYGSYGCGYGYGGYATTPYHSYGYWIPLSWYGQMYGHWYGYSYGRGFGGMGFVSITGGTCAVVRAQTYSGRTYSIRVQLPVFGVYGPKGLKRVIMQRMTEDGTITLQGRGSQELHLYDGFVQQLSTRWCEAGEF